MISVRSQLYIGYVQDGDTALHKIARDDRLDLCKLLVERGADIKARNKVSFSVAQLPVNVL